MDLSHVPDDIWIEIFQLLPRRQLAANVQPTCRLFHGLAANLLLHHVLWLTPAQIKDELSLWSTRNANALMLPRSLCITPHLELETRMRIWSSIPIPMITPEKPLYHSIHAQLPLFTSLRVLTLSNIALSEDTYRAFQLLPALRSLRILNSEYCDLELPSAERRDRMNLPPIQLDALPITNLCLHNVAFDTHPRSLYHPVCLLICPSLTSLAITWNSDIAAGYLLHVHDALSQNHLYVDAHNSAIHLASATHPRASPNLTDVEIRIPVLQDKLFEGLVSLASPSPSLVPPLRVKIHVIKGILSSSKLMDLASTEGNQSRNSGNRASLTGIVPNVWSYTGPFNAMDAFIAKKRHTSDETPRVYIQDALEDLSTPLTQLRLRPPGTSVSSLVESLERLMRPLELEHLEVCIYSWDVEILFAVKELCPNVVRLVVRYGEGVMDEGHLITLGSSIFSGLKRLHTLRLLYDPRCAKDVIMRRRRGFDLSILYGFDPSELDFPEDIAQLAPQAEETHTDDSVDTIPLEDCLAVWQLYCPSLRRVQVGGGKNVLAWRRRWYGDAWHKVWVEDVEDPEERGDSDYGWGDGGDDEDEGEIWGEFGNGAAWIFEGRSADDAKI